MSQLPKRIRRAVSRVIIAGLFLALVLPGGAPALAAGGKDKVIIFVIDQVSLSEIRDTGASNIKDLIKRGGVGVASVISKDKNGQTPEYLTIGAGNKAAGVDATAALALRTPLLEGFGFGERISGRAAGEIYSERTGRKILGNQAANLSISALIKANSTGEYNAVPGSLGEALEKKGLKTAAIGNADTSTEYGRAIIDIVMDKKGIVNYGRLDKRLLLDDAAFPSGSRTDPDRLYAAFTAAYAMSDVVAVEWGDTSRVRGETDYITPGREKELIKQSIKRADSFIGEVLKIVDLKKDLLIIVSPAASVNDAAANQLVTPVIMSGPEIGVGLLTSASTRRPEAVINVDIAPTVLNHFGLETPADMTGRPIFAKQTGKDSLETVISATQRWVTVRALMNSGLRLLAYWDIFVLGLFIVLLLAKKYRVYAARIRWALLTVSVIPLVYLLLPLLNYGSTMVVMVEIVVLTALIVALVYNVARRPVEAVGMIGLATAATLLIDLATGARLAQDSLLGYSVLSGARFYGIGNEFAGVLIGSVIIGAFYIVTNGHQEVAIARKLAASALLIISAGMMGASGLGAEFGSLLAAVAGFGVMALGIFREKYRTRDILVLAGLGFAAIAAFVGYDLSTGVSGGSHVGRLAAQIQAEGLAPLYTIAGRKIAMNIKLIQFAFWNWVNIASGAALVIAFYGLKNLLKLVFQRYPYFKPTMVGGLICCVGALVFNDSGVVAMAMIFLYLVPATLYLMTYET